MDTRDLVDQLNAFADAESIKEFLKLMDVKGYPQDEESCPISNWIRRSNPDCVVTTTQTIAVYRNIYAIYDPSEEYQISPAVLDFIRKFDEGLFPELEIEDYYYE